jgi:hypothetical protein
MATTGRTRKTARALTNERLTELAQKLSLWANEHGFLKDPATNYLIGALKSGENLTQIAQIPILEFLPMPGTQRSHRRMKLVSTFTIFRNVLVFVPVALTWLAVSKSTTAFANYTAANKNSVVNFLEFWQNGYGFLSKEWTIGHIAFLDFIVILTIILITLYGSFVTRREDRLQNEEIDKLEKERAILALEIQIELLKDQELSVPTFNATTNNTLRNLNQAAKSLSQAAKDLEKTYKAESKVTSRRTPAKKETSTDRWSFLEEA